MSNAISKRSLWVKISVALVILLLLVFGGYFFIFQNVTSKMSPVETQEVIPRYFAIKNNFVNFYLIEMNDGEKYFAIDAGSDALETRKELNHLGISSDSITTVFLTHTHADHTSALSLFDKATVYAGEKTKFNKVSRTLADNEIVEISGILIKCIFTPGHSDDSVSYLVDDKYLFVGDTLSLNDNKVELFVSFFNTDDEIQKADIKRLSELNTVQYIFSAHYGFTDKAIFP